MDDGTSPHKTCSVCGDTLRPDNSIGICSNNSKPACVTARNREYKKRRPTQPYEPRPVTKHCEICKKPLNANNQSGLCDGKDSQPCKQERNRRRPSVGRPAKPEPRRCDVCGVPLRRDNTSGVCGNMKKPDCLKERKRRKALGLIPGRTEPAVTAGSVFGNWTALEDARIETAFVLCRCKCKRDGSERKILARNLILGISTNCGCESMWAAAQKRWPNPYIAAGTVFGRLTVLEDVRRQQDGARCRCECGNSEEVAIAHPGDLKSGNTRSCGCLRLERITKHGLTGHPLFSTWRGVIYRCTNPKASGFGNYGGRKKPIKVCDRWLDPAAFIEDVEREIGPRPEGRSPSGAPLYTIDRWPDNDGDYEPGNVRWATQSEQVINQRKVGTLTEERDMLATALDECAAERDVLTAEVADLEAEVARLRAMLADENGDAP